MAVANYNMKEKQAPSKLEVRRMGIKEKFSNAQFIYNELMSLFSEGDLASTTDIISAYISNSHKYKNQDEFAEAIGTNRQTLHRMLSNGNVSMNLYFKAIERIYDDQEES
jgi:DNA-binding phage protein